MGEKRKASEVLNPARVCLLEGCLFFSLSLQVVSSLRHKFRSHGVWLALALLPYSSYMLLDRITVRLCASVSVSVK